MLAAMNDDQLWEATKFVFGAERLTILQTIRHLREIDKRNLGLKRGYGSLLEVCQEEFKLEKTSAFQRIACLRFCDDVPEAEAKLEAGTLSMSLVSILRRFFRKQEDAGKAYTHSGKIEIVERVEGLSCMEAQKFLTGLNPEFTDPDGADFVSERMVKVRAHIHENHWKNLGKLKDILSHKHPAMTIGDLLETLIGDGIEKYSRQTEAVDTDDLVPTSEPELNLERKRLPIPAKIRRQVWSQADAGCAFVSDLTGRRCGSHYMLEIDHIIPIADGGRNDLLNLRLCCDKHNRFRARQRFGPDWKKHKKRSN